MVEEKVLAKVRAVLTADATLATFVGDRVYAEHISSVRQPKLPAISLTLLPGQARTDVMTMVNMVFQVDLWFPVNEYDSKQIMECYDRVRALLHKQPLTDAAIGITVMQTIETGIGPILYDEPLACHHLPARYAAVAV